MGENGIHAKQKRKFKAAADPKHSHPVAPYLLEPDFEAGAPNNKGSADITCIHTLEGWLCLAEIRDLYSRTVVGGSMVSRMNMKLVLDALEMAVGRHRQGPVLPHQPDRGSRSACGDYQRALHAKG